MKVFPPSFIVFFGMFLSCEKPNYTVVCSVDGNTCITLFFFDSIQVLADGVHRSMPDSSFVMVDVSSKDIAVDNCLNICWGKKPDKVKWEAVIANSRIIELKLDTNHFLFRTELPIGSSGFPSEAKFRGDGCATLDIDSKRFSPPTSSAIIKNY